MTTAQPRRRRRDRATWALTLIATAFAAACASTPGHHPVVISEHVSIGSADELLGFRDAWNRGEFRQLKAATKITLTGDIDLGAIERWQPIGTRRDPFDGVLDGQGHTIAGKLTCDTRAGDFEIECGLFGDLQASSRNTGGAIIRDVKLAIELGAHGIDPSTIDSAHPLRPQVKLRIGALSGHANRAHLDKIHLASTSAIRVNANEILPHSEVTLAAGGLIGAGAHIEGKDLSTAATIDVAAGTTSVGGLFGLLGQSSFTNARVDGAIKARGTDRLSAGGLAGDLFNELGRNATPMNISDIEITAALDLWSGGQAVAGSLSGHLIAARSHVERIRASGHLALTSERTSTQPKEKVGFDLPNLNVGGLVGTMAMASLNDTEVTARVSIAFAGEDRRRLGAIGGILGQASLMVLQNAVFAGAIELTNTAKEMSPSVGGLVGHTTGAALIANSLVQGSLPEIKSRDSKGIVGLTDQRGHFLFCTRWPKRFRAVGHVSRRAKIHATSSPLEQGEDSAAAALVEAFNAPLESSGRPQRCLTPGKYLPWKVNAEGRATLDFDAVPRPAREFIGSTSILPRHVHWNHRVELKHWETAEVQKRWWRMKDGMPPFPAWHERHNCGPLTNDKLGLPVNAPCLFSEGDSDLPRCDGVRGPRRLRHLRFEFARERLESLRARRVVLNGKPVGAFLDGDYRMSLQGLAMTAHVFALTPSVGVESFLNEGQGAFGGENHLTLLAMDRERLESLAARTQIFEQLRTPDRRGDPILPEAMKGAPAWVYWNCFDALNHGHGQTTAVANPKGETARGSDAKPEIRRFPFCGVGRAGDDVTLPDRATREMFATQEARDALAESIEHWLKTRHSVRDRIREEGDAAGDEEAWRAAHKRLSALPFDNFELGCGVSDLVIANADKILRTERWTSADGEVWALAAIDEQALIDLLTRDEALSDEAAELAAKELADSFAKDAEKRRQRAEHALSSTHEPKNCHDLAAEHLGWEGDFHCAAIPVPSQGKKKKADTDLITEALRSQISHFVLHDLLPPEPPTRANDTIPLARLSIADAIEARTGNLRHGVHSITPSKQPSPPPQPTPGVTFATFKPVAIDIHIAALDKTVLNAQLARVSFVEQLRDPSRRGKAPTSPEMAGAPAWVRWTCFDALRNESSENKGQASQKRFPYCSVAAKAPGSKERQTARKAADRRLAQTITGNVALQFRHYLEEMRPKAPDASLNTAGMSREQLREQRRKARYPQIEEMKRLQDAQMALLRNVDRLKFTRRTWKSADGESWAMSAVDEAALLRVVRQTKELGPEFAAWFQKRLEASYAPAPSPAERATTKRAPTRQPAATGTPKSEQATPTAPEAQAPATKPAAGESQSSEQPAAEPVPAPTQPKEAPRP